MSSSMRVSVSASSRSALFELFWSKQMRTSLSMADVWYTMAVSGLGI